MAEGTTDFIGRAVALQPNDDYLTQACEPMITKCQLYLGELWSRSQRADFVRFLTFKRARHVRADPDCLVSVCVDMHNGYRDEVS